ncbi:MAG: ParB/RepB/Spo0J family partition protein [Nitrospira sp.]|nr:ParB/RepB/Spo0J family partition protein [Nitrospira sp.]MDD9860789.1 ParB/RepB/Spo0J family partition protein [Nitrospira sp.]
MSKTALGKGLEAILPGKHVPGNDQALRRLPVSRILANKAQPRKTFDEHELQELTESIRQHGLLHPVLVRSKGGDFYELIAGERRFRAAKRAKLTEIPAMIRPSQDDESTVLALIENIQRVNLNPVEEAKAYRQLMDEFRLTQEEVARRVGRDRASVANLCRILSLPRDVHAMLESGQLTLGHAKIIVGVESADAQREMAKRIVREQLSVRQTERLAGGGRGRGSRKTTSRSTGAGTRTLEADVEDRLRKHLRTKVTLRPKARGGDVMLSYASREELARIVEAIVG